jgi:hypothetical protein
MPIVAATPQPVRMNPRREITAVADTASFADPSSVSRVVRPQLSGIVRNCPRAALPE